MVPFISSFTYTMITTYMLDIFLDLSLKLNYILKVGHHYELFMFLKAFDAVIHHGCIKLVKNTHIIK